MPKLPPYHKDPRKYYDVLQTLTPEELRQEWKEITLERFEYYLGCVPPHHYNGHSFYVGEAATHGEYGPIHDLCVRVSINCRTRYFMRPAYIVFRSRENYEQEINTLFSKPI
jgi:hypothetical protein